MTGIADPFSMLRHQSAPHATPTPLPADSLTFSHARAPLPLSISFFSSLHSLVAVSSVFDQFPGGGGGVGGGGWERGGQGGAGGETISFGPSIEDFSSLGGAREGGRAGGGRGGETGGELQTKGGGSGDVTALGPIMPFVGQLVPRISLDLVEQVRHPAPLNHSLSRTPLAHLLTHLSEPFSCACSLLPQLRLCLCLLAA